MSNTVLQMISNVAILSDLISISINHNVIIANCYSFWAKMLISLYNHTIAVCFSLKLFHLRGLIKQVFRIFIFSSSRRGNHELRLLGFIFQCFCLLSSFFPIIKKAFISQMNHQARCKFLSNCIFKGFCLVYCQKSTLLSMSERKISIFFHE